MLFLASTARADTATLTSTITAKVKPALSMEFAGVQDTNTAISWDNVDSSGENNVIPPTNRPKDEDGGDLADVGVIVKYNGTRVSWYLMISLSGDIDLTDKVKFYMKQPINRNTTLATDGALGFPTPPANSDWPKIPAAPAVVYTSGPGDTINTPFGTFVGISYGLNPVGLEAGTSYTGTVTYTLIAGV